MLEVSAASSILHEFKESLKAVFPSLQNVPHIFCGDFNIEPHFAAYKVLKCGELDEDDLKTLKTTDYIKYLEDEDCSGKRPATNEVKQRFKMFLFNGAPAVLAGKNSAKTSLVCYRLY